MKKIILHICILGFLLNGNHVSSQDKINYLVSMRLGTSCPENSVSLSSAIKKAC